LSLPPVFQRLIPLLLAGLGVWFIGQTPLHQWLDYWLRDHQQRISAEEHHFPGSLVVDIDDPSLKRLEPLIGTWPYGRDVYAKVLDYLAEKGAAQVVFDILFAEAREGDAALQAAQQRHPIATYVASASAKPLSLSAAEQQRIQQLSWEVEGPLAAPQLSALLLPRPEISQGAQARIGLVTASADLDSLIRRLPLLYRTDSNHYLPALPLRTLVAEHRPKVVAGSTHLEVYGYRIPVDAKGQALLYYPSNANAILTLPFYDLAEAAYGKRKVHNAEQLLTGKTVFIGSTAYLSDRVNTSRGPMSGTYLLALAHETLASGLTLRPDRALWNGLMGLFALLPGLVYALRQGSGPTMTLGLPLVTALLLLGLNFGLLHLERQSSDLLPPLELLGLLALLTTLHHQWWVKRQNRVLQQQNEELNNVANTDALTGLNNRRAFLLAFKQEQERVRRHGGALPSIAIMDLDKFKSVNDTYGHDIGDIVLKIFAEVLRKSVRTIDIPARWGGEEFVVLLPRTQVEDARVVLERVRIEISQRSIPQPAEALKVTVSIGLASVKDAWISADECVKSADAALYIAKESGRNRICLAEEEGPESDLTPSG
jgi:diguanylate cyclase